MLNKISLFSIIMAVALIFAGCSQGQEEVAPTGAEVAAPDLATLAEDMYSAGTWEDELMLLDPAVVPNLYTLDDSSIAEFAVYASSTMSTPEEVAVFVATDEESLAYVEEMINIRLQNLTFSFEDYLPEEMPKIEDAKVLKNGLYMALVVSGDTAPIEKAFNDAFGG